ncbi:hypothetical protein BST61_g2042 [Cercospora zeina]
MELNKVEDAAPASDHPRPLNVRAETLTSTTTSAFDITAKKMSPNSDAADTAQLLPATSQHPAAGEEEKAFRLLDLPPELVVRVLGFALIINHKSKLTHTYTWQGVFLRHTYMTSFKLYKQPAITKTCHWLRNEGLSIFYSRNSFLVTASDLDNMYLGKWIATLQAEHLEKMKFHVMWTCSDGTFYLDGFRVPWMFARSGTKLSDEQKRRQGRKGYVRILDGNVKITYEIRDGIEAAYAQVSLADRSHEQMEWQYEGHVLQR